MNEPRPAPDSDLLEPQIRALFVALDHAGELSGATPKPGRVVRGEAGREALGTRVRFSLRLAEGRVAAVRYRAYGCPHTLATCEWLPPAKLGRLLVIEDALQAALAQA